MCSSGGVIGGCVSCGECFVGLEPWVSVSTPRIGPNIVAALSIFVLDWRRINEASVWPCRVFGVRGGAQADNLLYFQVPLDWRWPTFTLSASSILGLLDEINRYTEQRYLGDVASFLNHSKCSSVWLSRHLLHLAYRPVMSFAGLTVGCF